ncbi:MAG: methylmalonyl-CoA mutase family protein [Nocardioidaceae bacterium]
MTDDRTVEGGLDEPEEFEPVPGSLALASAEDTRALADWEAAAAAVLRKARRMSDDDSDELVWGKLSRRTLDGIAITPLGTPDLLEGVVTAGRPARAGDWDIRAYLSGSDAKSINEEALVDLNGGVTSLWVRADPDVDLATLLDGVHLDLAPVVLDGSDPDAFVRFSRGGELHPATNLGVDARVSTSSTTEPGGAARLALDAGILGFVVDATTVHDRGASEAQELGYSMAVGAAYLRDLTGAGVSIDEAAGLVEFRYAVTDDQFPSIAKLRAARRLWARVLELSEASPVEQRQHAVTSRPMMSKYDPWVNMLRTTVAAFAAGAGGADSVTVLPFDSPLGRPDALGRRIARNTSALLISESHVARVADPAGGAYAVEKLTDDLAVAAWGVLGRIEDGQPFDERIAEVVAEREEGIARRTRPLTGLTEFPNLAEVLPKREIEEGAAAVRRYGASFEALRDAPAAAPVFLATLGTVAEHTTRATFAANLFAAGGIAVEVAGPTADVGELLTAYRGQAVVCLAGCDAAYDDRGSKAIVALREAGARWVVVAGVSTSSTTEMFEGADDSCAMGVDTLDFLTRTRGHLL